MATLKDVAKLAGVDPSVVSRIINNDKSLSIKAETRRQVLEAIEKLNYRPNAIARSLKKGETKMLGMVIPDFSNPVYSSIIRGAESQAVKEGYHLMVCSLQSEANSTYLPLLREGRVDGLLVACSEFEDTHLPELDKEDVPFILVNRLSKGSEKYVVTDDVFGTKLAVKHLIELGHTRIAHLAGPLYTGTGLERFQGYRLALQEAGIEFKPNYMFESKYTAEDGYRGMNTLLDLPEPPTAVFAGNIMICLGAMKAAQERGLTIPDDISLVGFHDVFFASMLYPPLTTVKMPLFEMGQEAVKKITKILRGEEVEQSLRIPGASLVVRGSTAAPRD